MSAIIVGGCDACVFFVIVWLTKSATYSKEFDDGG